MITAVGSAFIPGLQLSREFFTTAVQPLLHDRQYAAALLGPGSEVLGFDRPEHSDSTHARTSPCWTGFQGDTSPVLIRRENTSDTTAIHDITAAAFGRAAEARLVDELRADPAWMPALSLVAVTPANEVIGHVLCTRGHVDEAIVLGLGPLTVRPDHQRRGVGSALMHAVIGAADALDEPLIALLGNPAYYVRFGFRPSTDYEITPPKPEWQPHFQVRTLAGYQPSIRGHFTYPEPFDRT